MKLILKDGQVYNESESNKAELVEVNDYAKYLGDIHPFQHGGTMFFKEDGSNEIIRFISFVPQEDIEEEKVNIQHGLIDITDSWIEKESVASYADVCIDEDDEKYCPFQLAWGILAYYGAHEFGGNDYSEEVTEEQFKEGYNFFGHTIEYRD